MEGGVAKAEGPEHGPGEIVIEHIPAHASDDLAQQDEAGVAVLEARAGRIVERFGRQRPGRPRKATGEGFGAGDRWKPGAVGHDPTDGHLLEGSALELLEITAERRV